MSASLGWSIELAEDNQRGKPVMVGLTARPAHRWRNDTLRVLWDSKGDATEIAARLREMADALELRKAVWGSWTAEDKP